MYSIFHFSPFNSVQIVDFPRGSLCSFIPLSRLPSHPSLIPPSSLTPHGHAGQTQAPPRTSHQTKWKEVVFMNCVYVYIQYIIILLFKPKWFANVLLLHFYLSFSLPTLSVSHPPDEKVKSTFLISASKPQRNARFSN